MNPKVVTVCAILALISTSSAQPQISCTYSFQFGGNYVCTMTTINKDGFDAFVSIGGVHRPGMGNAEVRVLTNAGTLSKNIPRILCDTFPNVETITFRQMELEEISAVALRGCRRLEQLVLTQNKLRVLAPNAFGSNPLLWRILMDSNILANFPNGIFKPLQRLQILVLSNNRLRTIRTEWFGNHPELTNIILDNNSCNATTPVIFEKTALNFFSFQGNVCMSGSWRTSRELIKKAMTKCIFFYEN